MYRRIASIKSSIEFRQYLEKSHIDIEFDEVLQTGQASPLAQAYRLQDGFVIGNRFCVQPMEGWDGTTDGRPSELTYRRWRHFGQSGAKLIWGGEAAAIQPDGRANPNQLMITENTLADLAQLRQTLVEAHAERFTSTHDLLIGLQLTHSGRFARPNSTRLEPKILYHHPYLDKRFGLPDDYPVLTDHEIEQIIVRMVQSAQMAQQIGFDFVDIKHCHGYLGHEFLSAYTRPGPYGGSFENRTRFLRQVTAGIRQAAPGLRIGVRFSAFDMPPFSPAPGTRRGQPVVPGDYPWGFGVTPQAPYGEQLDEPIRFLDLLQELGIELVNVTGGSPYYTPHIQRPAMFPPSDGYLPPEDPLAGVARHVRVTAALKQRFPHLLMVGTGYSYLQEWLPHVAQYQVRNGRVDFIGLGRMVLSYPTFAADVLASRRLDRKHICRTFSDCTTGPRKGLPSGCYPLDEFYKARPEAITLQEIKQSMT